MDPNSGFCPVTKTYHSLRPNTISLPPPSQPLSITEFIFSNIPSSASKSPVFIHAATGHSLTYADFVLQTKSLALSLQKHYNISKGDVAFILSPDFFHLPTLIFSLLSLGVVISPSIPLDSISEISCLIDLVKPSIAFTDSKTSHKLPTSLPTVAVDSSEFLSFLTHHESSHSTLPVVSQHDESAIFFSSGTSGKSKGVTWTHRNLIVAAAATSKPYHDKPWAVSLISRPLNRVYGMTVMMSAVLKGETLVCVDGKSEMEDILGAIEKYKVDYMPVSPFEVLKLVRSELTSIYDISSLKFIICGGAPLCTNVSRKFKDKFPHIKLLLRYGLTEATGAVSTMRGSMEAEQIGSVGRLVECMEAKIVDPQTHEPLSPGRKGELWLRGPSIMKGYVGDKKVNAETLNSEGWLKTGDLMYIDSRGFLYIVDRLKDIIICYTRKIAPVELEDLLLSNPEIADVAVVPYPDEEASQVPMAFVVKRSGSNISAPQIMDFIAKQAGCIYGLHSEISHRKDFTKRVDRSDFLCHQLCNGNMILHF